MRRTTFAFVLLALSVTVVGAHQRPARPAPTRVTIADGVYLYRTAPYGPVGLDGNAVAIVTTQGVVMFDSNGTPSAAEAILADLVTVTDQPVRFVVNSHWHWDHWYGTEVYRRRFPEVRVVAHEKTRQMMLGPALEFNRPGLEEDLPDFIASLEARAARDDSPTPPGPSVGALRDTIAQARSFLDEKRGVTHIFPDVTFTDQLSIHLGGREIQILNYGRGVTPGDAFIYLPADRVLITGDLLVNPVSFALSCYPTEWLSVLDRLDALDVVTIVPGHGEPLRDKTLLTHTRSVFRILLAEGAKRRQQGLDVDAARAAIMPALSSLADAMVGNAPANRAAFETQLVDWFLHRVYEELDGPLSDVIAPIPVKFD